MANPNDGRPIARRDVFPLLPRRMKIASMGDSRLDQFTRNTTPYSPQSTDPLTWATFFCDGAIVFGVPESLHFAVGGATTAQMISNQLDNVIASDADAVAMYVCTNSTSAFVPALTMMADIDTAYNAVYRAGKLLIVFSENPRTGYGDQARRQTHRVMAEYLRRLRDRPGVIVIDPWMASVDRASLEALPKTGYTEDGLHESTYFAMVLGRMLATEILKMVSPPNLGCWTRASIYDAANENNGPLTSNTNLDGTGGSKGTGITNAGVSGGAADGWTFGTSDAAMTATVAKLVDANGFPFQRLIVSGTPTTSLPVISVSKAIGDIAWLAAGQKIQLSSKIAIASGHTGLVSPTAVIIPSGASSARQWSHYVDAAFISQINGEAMAGRLLTQKYTVPASLPTTMTFYDRFFFKQNEAASATIDIYDITPRLAA